MCENQPNDLPNLRLRAENALRQRLAGRIDPASISTEEAQRLLHELQIHQIELEMQNDDLRRTQETLAEKINNFADLYNTAPTGYLTLDGKGTIRMANLRAATLLSREVASLKGRLLHTLVHKDDLGILHRFMREIAESAGSGNCEIRLKRKRNRIFFALLDGRAVKVAENHDSKFRITISDISRRKEVEQALHESEASMEAVLDGSVDGIMNVGHSGVVKSVNPAINGILGFHRKELIGRNLQSLLQEADPRAENRGEQGAIHKLLQEHSGGWVETAVLRKDGVAIPVAVTVCRTNTAKAQQFICFIRDLREHKKIEQMRKRFFEMASHELRTPLTNINFALDILTKGEVGELPPQGKEMVAIARRGSQRLERLVYDILDVQKYDTVAIGFRVEALELMPLVDEAIQGCSIYAERFGVSYCLNSVLPDTVVHGDGDRLIQVMNNLLTNAARFSPRNGLVAVDVQRIGTSVRVAVTDHGKGVPKEFHDFIFQPFFQAEPTLEDSGNKENVGLGLSIAKSIIDRLGGRIGFESAEGNATTFFFELPIWNED